MVATLRSAPYVEAVPFRLVLAMPRIHLSILSVLLLGAAGACSAGSSRDTPSLPRPTSVAAPPAAPAAPSDIFAYRPFTPPVHMSVQRRDSTIVSLGDAGDQAQVSGQTAFFTVGTRTIGRSGPHILEVTLDSVTTEGRDANTPASAVGVRWSGDRTEHGLLHDLTATRESDGVAQIGHLAALLFPILPEGGAAVGSIWKQTRQRVVHANPFDVRDSLVASYRADSMVTVAGVQWLHFTEEAFYTREGTATNSTGATLPVSGFGISSISYYVSMDGRLVRANGVDSTSMTIMVPETGARIPVRQIGRISILPLP